MYSAQTSNHYKTIIYSLVELRLAEKFWDPELHPRVPGGTSKGGEFTFRGTGTTTVSPDAGGIHSPTGYMAHGQEVLRIEIRCVCPVSRGRNSVRNSSPTAPICPDVSNACATALRRSCGNDVA